MKRTPVATALRTRCAERTRAMQLGLGKTGADRMFGFCGTGFIHCRLRREERTE